MTENKTPEKKISSWAILIGVLLVLGIIYGKSDENKSETSKNTKTDEVIIDANNIVQKGFAVCFTKDSAADLINLAAQKDGKGVDHLFESQKCFLLKPGTSVSILERNTFSPSKIRAYMDNGKSADLYTDFYTEDSIIKDFTDK